MHPFGLRTIIILAIGAMTLCVTAQDKKKLERKRAELSKKIAQTSQLISKTQSEQKSKQLQLQALSNQIKLREELIHTIGAEVGHLDQSIVQRHQSIASQRSELDKLKAQYALLIQRAQKTQSHTNKLMFIFAAPTFNQAIRRLRYIKEYSEHRREQAKKIEELQLKLSHEVQVLSDQKIQKKSLLSAKENEKNNLARDKSAEEKTLDQLRSQEKSLRAELKKQEEERNKISREIERLLASEIKKSKTANKGTFTLAPAAKELSTSFERNLGKLPWPVDKGFISGRFGRQAHPVIKNIVIDNNGIDITTDKEAIVKAIFKGTVSSILIIPGAGKVVVLDHGAYRSIYTQLKEVYVSKGQSVSTKDKLGKCLVNETSTQSIAHLEIWKIGQNGTEKLNPALWLSK